MGVAAEITCIHEVEMIVSVAVMGTMLFSLVREMIFSMEMVETIISMAGLEMTRYWAAMEMTEWSVKPETTY
jgi:hypothetical protein